MQHKQENYRIAALAGLVLVALVFAGKTAFSAGIADRGKPDPILSGGAVKADAGPCDRALDLADMTPGVDVNGQPVAPADLPAAPAHFDGQVAVPLKPMRGRGANPAYVMVDGKRLDPLLNPPACH